MSFYITTANDDYLAHHGVKGMKWGVRRYQNFNGSYTQAGLKRYEKSAAAYEELKAKKKQYGSKTMMNSKMTYGRATKLAKQQMKKDYKHLKQDKLADQGKNLYANGYRITDNMGVNLVKGSGTAASAIGFAYANDFINKKQAEGLGAIAGATAAIGTGMSIVNYNKDRKLRAYYGHASNY